MQVQDMVSQVNAITSAARENSDIIPEFNRSLAQLADVLYLPGMVAQAWSAGVTSYAAPADVFRFRDWGQVTNGSDTSRIHRVNPLSEQTGWWFNGANIGISPIPQGTITLKLSYYRFPKLFLITDTTAEPEGGDQVSLALIEYSCREYYLSQGDDESAKLAARFNANFQDMKQQILVSRRKLVLSTPSEWGRR